MLQCASQQEDHETPMLVKSPGLEWIQPSLRPDCDPCIVLEERQTVDMTQRDPHVSDSGTINTLCISSEQSEERKHRLCALKLC